MATLKRNSFPFTIQQNSDAIFLGTCNLSFSSKENPCKMSAADVKSGGDASGPADKKPSDAGGVSNDGGRGGGNFRGRGVSRGRGGRGGGPPVPPHLLAGRGGGSPFATAIRGELIGRRRRPLSLFPMTTGLCLLINEHDLLSLFRIKRNPNEF